MNIPHGETAASLGSFIFPNDFHVHWSLMIVLYPYISGLVAGAFIVFALYHVFKIKSLQPISRLSLMVCFSFLAVTTMPLVNHLGRPERNLNMLITPSMTSAMAGFGYIYNVVALIVTLIILLLYRPTLLELKEQSTGIKRKIYTLLTFGSDNLSQESLDLDKKVVNFLAATGIPLASILTSYVGFIFGSVKANPLWTTPLMPVIFLLSASVSGMAAVILAYTIFSIFTRRAIDTNCLRTCVKYLWGFFIFAFTLEMLEVFAHGYLATHHWHTLETLLWGPLYQSYWVYQVQIFSLIPFFMLAILSLIKVSDGVLKFFAPLASFMLLIQVFLMRWNVVVGGQLMSKSERGSVFYHVQWLEKEGLLPAVIFMGMALVILFILARIFPLWQDKHSEVKNI